tara:strand:- start:10131 stop:11783 length:1653 start_codon:yes stop_codon:yes gene_type:complete
MQQIKKPLLIVLFVIIVMNLSRDLFLQFDLTQDKRYSLSETTLLEINRLDKPLRIDIFLSGDLPVNYLRFRNELDALVSQLMYNSDKIVVKYIDPFEGRNSKDVIQEMKKYGMDPELVIENKNGNRMESLIFPWMMVNYNNKSELIPLLINQLGETENEKITRSLQQMEYNIMDGIYRVRNSQKKNLAILTSHNTSKNIKIVDLLQNLKPYYNLAAFDLKIPEITPEQILKNLNRFDALIISNPNEAFSQTEKYIFDQYDLQGGKILWMVNGMSIDRDSLFNKMGKAYSLNNELNLDDYFFHNGIRIQKTLIQDIYCAPIVLARNNDNNAQYIPYPWVYYPLSEPEKTLIGRDIGPVLTQFVSSIDTISNSLSKTMLIKSSKFTKTPLAPTLIELNQATKKIYPSEFNETSKAMGYLIQGKQKSLFKNRIKPFKNKNHLEFGKTEIIIFSDGNISENQVDKGSPLTLGYDKWTNNFYANRILIMNSIHFLTGNENRLALRDKSWKFAILDNQKIKLNGMYIKWLMLLTPIILILGSGMLNQLLRSKHIDA